MPKKRKASRVSVSFVPPGANTSTTQEEAPFGSHLDKSFTLCLACFVHTPRRGTLGLQLEACRGLQRLHFSPLLFPETTQAASPRILTLHAGWSGHCASCRGCERGCTFAAFGQWPTHRHGSSRDGLDSGVAPPHPTASFCCASVRPCPPFCHQRLSLHPQGKEDEWHMPAIGGSQLYYYADP